MPQPPGAAKNSHPDDFPAEDEIAAEDDIAIFGVCNEALKRCTNDKSVDVAARQAKRKKKKKKM